VVLQDVIEITREVGAAVLEVYGNPCAVRRKDDGSPVTEADERAQAVICARLAQLTPGVPVIAEEACTRSTEPLSGRFWLVDPLDGT
jgi:3'(2'), 5'-bisphosphate nucleotidase